MTTLIDAKLTTVLRRAAVRATRAPSVHNTQPWHFAVGPDRIEMRTEPDRRLQVLDPHGRQMLLSCGCALFNARVSLAEAGYAPVIERFPDPDEPGLFAVLRVDGADATTAGPDHDIAELATAIDLRQTNRRHFDDYPVPTDVVDDAVRAASIEGAEILVVTRPEDRIAVAML
ncbi:MAG TPA: hypothetical protein VKQ07_02295, partial [Jatrophihabitantaceae bacterium]|nr:hypothetical protein [Jatrophihabitantaceae bacterium]